jgi:hypothetical protein
MSHFLKGLFENIRSKSKADFEHLIQCLWDANYTGLITKSLNELPYYITPELQTAKGFGLSNKYLRDFPVSPLKRKRCG